MLPRHGRVSSCWDGVKLAVLVSMALPALAGFSRRLLLQQRSWRRHVVRSAPQNDGVDAWPGAFQDLVQVGLYLNGRVGDGRVLGHETDVPCLHSWALGTGFLGFCPVGVRDRTI